jgi:hypothetical protein
MNGQRLVERFVKLLTQKTRRMFNDTGLRSLAESNNNNNNKGIQPGVNLVSDTLVSILVVMAGISLSNVLAELLPKTTGTALAFSILLIGIAVILAILFQRVGIRTRYA